MLTSIFDKIFSYDSSDGKSNHRTMAMLLIITLGFSGYVFSQTEKLDEDKADIEIVKQMLQQSRELIELQRAAQEIQMAELKRVELKVDDRVSAIEKRIGEVKGDQRVLEIKQDVALDSVLDKLDRLSDAVSELNKTVSKKVNRNE